MTDGNRHQVLFAGLAAYVTHGGIQRFNRRVIDALGELQRGASVLMMADPPGAGSSAGAKIDIKCAGGRRADFIYQFAARARRADVLLLGHINLLPLAVLYRLMRPKGRVILFAHGIEVWGDPPYRKHKSWEPRALRFAVDRVAVVSDYSRDRMARAFRFPIDRFSSFPNAVDIIPLPARSAAAPVILTVSRLAPTEREKHVDKLIQAMPAVLTRVPEARLVIIGDGALRTELEQRAHDLGVAHHVDFRGFASDEELARAYVEAALFALPSSKEGFGIVYLEAWLRGLPVIGSRFGGGAEVVTDGMDGFSVDPVNIDRLAEAMITLLVNVELARKFAASGRQKVEQRYSMEVFARNLRELIAL